MWNPFIRYTVQYYVLHVSPFILYTVQYYVLRSRATSSAYKLAADVTMKLLMSKRRNAVFQRSFVAAKVTMGMIPIYISKVTLRKDYILRVDRSF
jgi:hypothetical protein